MLLAKSCRRLNRPPAHFSPESLSRLTSYHWPGNVRELENVIERAVILSEGERITPDLLALAPAPPAPHEPLTNEKLSLDDYFVRFVRDNQNRMTETELAKQLGISRKTLWERRQRLAIPRANKEPR
jgi:DNA-binding NtrC family response regulator